MAELSTQAQNSKIQKKTRKTKISEPLTSFKNIDTTDNKCNKIPDW